MVTMKELYEQIKNLNSDAASCVLTVISGEHIGEKALLVNGTTEYLSAPDGFFASGKVDPKTFSETGVYEMDGERIYAEVLGHGKTLVICGGGHVGTQLVRAARLIDFHVVLLEDRPMYANEAKLAGADEVVCDEFVPALSRIEGNADTFFVIVTRGHQYDEDCLREIIRKPHAYIGMIGSRRKTAIVKSHLVEEGVPRELVDSVHAPIGLNIGAETPAEIAIAITAEMIEIKNARKRNVGFSKEMLEALLEDAEPEGDAKKKVLCTIVTKKGSAPRGVASKLLIRSDGHCIGTIGGGCMEAGVFTHAREMMAAGISRPELYFVNLTAEDAREEGMVCGGTAEVFMEPV